MCSINSNKERKYFFLSLILIFSANFFFGQGKIQYSNDKIKFCDNTFFYQIVADSTISKDRILMLQYYNFQSSFNPGQSTISYDTCISLEKCEDVIRNNSATKFSHYELTGAIIENDKIWMHPTRSDNFRILEMNAFPYFESGKSDWNYTLDFGDHWGDKKWIEWEGRRSSVSKYKVENKEVSYTINNKEIKCVVIQADTEIPNLGRTNSIFYYNHDYGFVRMIFNTIDNKTIEFNLIKTFNDTNIN
ncbi:hypothetical protein J2X97_002252 [Epilithonimonas hungarica]|uniref:hypothetical protein n=1 Tax=Epilithonimonas hungarica TaxID=454006 RepID=UPI00277E1DD0|nr:hypothetical protein [Epilithonimonas hungarica]MDP9956593.1 hypothetical protein [Epilithonimonas hungarica]